MNDSMFALIITLLAMVAIIAIAPPPQAQQIKLVGKCGDKYYGAIYEDEFPENCTFIKKVSSKGE